MQLHIAATGHGTASLEMQRPQRSLSLPQHCRRCRSFQRQVCASSQQKAHAAQDTIRQARTQQIQATDLLARLLQAPDAKSVAAEHTESLTEEFFMMSSTYLEMARKEGNPDVSGKLEQVIKIAMDEKQKTLRPEIQLLNTLLACRTREERRKVYEAPDTLETLTMNDRYFFRSLLDRMIGDVKRQQPSPKQAQLSKQLMDVKDETERVVAQA